MDGAGVGWILPCRGCGPPTPTVSGWRCWERGGSIPGSGGGGLTACLFPPAYKTVCGVNGPLVVLDNVKVGARLPVGDKGTPRRCHFGLCGDHCAVPAWAWLPAPPPRRGGCGGGACPLSPVPWAVPSSLGSVSRLRAPSSGRGRQQSPCVSLHTRVGVQVGVLACAQAWGRV